MNKYRVELTYIDSYARTYERVVMAENPEKALEEARHGDYISEELIRNKYLDTEFVDCEEIELIEGEEDDD